MCVTSYYLHTLLMSGRSVGDYQPQSYCQFWGNMIPVDYSIMLPELSVTQLSVVANYAQLDNGCPHGTSHTSG